jgi:hypothetical protein
MENVGTKLTRKQDGRLPVHQVNRKPACGDPLTFLMKVTRPTPPELLLLQPELLLL